MLFRRMLKLRLWADGIESASRFQIAILAAPCPRYHRLQTISDYDCPCEDWLETFRVP